ncbi:MAG TPA: hypothetical protein VGK37_16955 [Casimicrobiaceae bacterium]
MADRNGKSELGALWWAKNLDEVDRELARLALVCNVPLLNPGVIERVLANDASVCASRNRVDFDKLRSLLVMHYGPRDRAVSAIGGAQTSVLAGAIVAELRKKLGHRLRGSAPQ